MYKAILAAAFALVVVASASAEITPNLIVYDVGPLQATGQEYVTYRLVVALSEVDDWTAAELTATVSSAVFYQDPDNDGNPPDPAGFAAWPDSEVTSYYTSPDDHPNAAYSGAAVGFSAGPTETAASLYADWYDVVDTGIGTFVIAQITVIPESSSWTGQVDVTVYSVAEPAGVSDSFTMSSSDYSPPVTATYIGASGGTYNSPGNWDVGAVPLNVGLGRYNVIIPGSTSVSLDVTGESTISGLALGYDSTFGFATGESLEVRGTSVISGIISASGAGAEFLAPSQFSAFAGSGPRVAVGGGGHVHVAAPSYYWKPSGNWTSTSLLTANGADSLLDLSSLTTMTVPQSYHDSNVYSYSVTASDNGVIDLSSLETVSGAGGNDWLRFTIAGGGDIDLSSLSLVNGRVWFDIDVPNYTLPALENASATHVDATNALTVDLPMLGAFSSGTFTVPNGASIDAPLLGSFRYSTMSIADGGQVSAPQLTDVTGSYFALNPARVLIVPPFANMDHSRLILDGGATLTVAATSYSWNPGGTWTSTALLSANGAGSALDLSSLTSVSVPYNYHSSNVYSYSISATDNGAIDLSSLETATGSGGNDWLRFHVATGGSLDLESLWHLDGGVYIDIDIPEYALPSLQESMTRVRFDLAEGTQLHLPVLERIRGSGNVLSVPVFATFDAPLLTEMSGATVGLTVGATLSAPSLTSFTSGVLTLTQVEQGGVFLDVPPFTSINHSRLFLEDGATFSVAATSYLWNPGGTWTSTTLLSADGAGTVLDMSSLNSINMPYSYHSSNVYYYSVVASNNGVLDLSGVSTISGAGGNDWLRFTNNSGGRILFGDVSVSSGRTRFAIDGTASRFDFAGGLNLGSSTELAVTLAATVSLTGDFTFHQTTESSFDTGGGILHFDGSGLQRLEIGGEDIGVPAGAIADNFEIGQLMVGQTTRPTVVKLVDQVNNGNRGTSGLEALYLQGFPGSDSGLRILGGSTLVIENLQLYVQEGDEWVHINSLFPPDTNQIAYDDGFIALSIVENDCDGNSIDDRVDIILGNSEDCNENEIPDECEIEVGSPAPGGPFYCTENCDPDCNVNGIPDACDIADGTSLDCNANGVPDDCDISDGTSNDTNSNGIPDECEDCNNNSIPDFQDMADCDGSAWCDDCNGNGVLDWCDTHYGTSDDVNGNIVPDECEADCQPNGFPDNWDIAQGTSQDCQPNGIPDECELAAGTSEDVNGNSVPDECEPDCQPNGLPDNWDIAQGISQDCQPNGVPDECDISSGTSDDVNGNGVPDECEPDCQPNGIPDDWDITQGTSEDCNENTVPDECDIASGASVDTDLNGVPDECQDCNGNSILDWMDIASGTSEDCNENQMPDECEAGFDTFQWIGPDGGSFLEPANWAPAQVPGGDALLLNTGPDDNRAVLNAPGEKRVCGLTVEATGAGLQILRIDTGSILHPASGTFVNAGGRIDLNGGALMTPTLSNSGASLAGYGHVNADVTNAGVISGAIGRTLTFTGVLFDNRPAGTVLVPSGSVVDIQSAGVAQAGRLEIRSQGVAGFTSALTNLSGADVSLLGGTLVAGGFVNAESARFSGFGTIDANAGNEGDFTLIGDTQLLGDLHNEGIVTLQDGTFLVMGDLTGSGEIIGNFFGKRGTNGLTVQGDLAIGAEATLTISNGTLAAEQGCDVAINDSDRFDFTAGTLQLAGDPSAGPQTLEVPSENVGRSVTLPDTKLFSLNKLRLGPTATTVHLADAHDNAPGAGNEALYVHDLVLDPGITLDLRGLRIYYVSVTPVNPFDPGSGVTVIDTVGGGGLIPIGPPIKGDWDGDADVDLTDYVQFPACLTGPDNSPVPGSCAAFDFEDDNDVDLTDYGAFQLALDRAAV